MIGWGFMSQANIPVPGLPLYYASVASLANWPTDQRINFIASSGQPSL